MSDQVFSSQCAFGAPQSVSKDKGVIYGAKIIEVGEAKGHGLFVDGEFLDKVTELGNGLTQGLKARFGHPNMCSTALGTFLGRWKGLYRDGDTVRGNLFLSNTAKETPHGNLHEYVLNLAADEPDMFGVSIDFTRDIEAEQEAGIDEKTGFQIARAKKLRSADAVDSPAATDGLFSRFSGETVAGQITRFLDENPDVWDALSDAPEIVESLARYGNKVDEFMDRYRSYRKQSKEAEMSTDETTVAEPTEEVVEELEATETIESEEALTEKEETAEAETTEEAESLEAEETETQPEEKPAELSREDFLRITDQFGAEIAAQTVRDGGSYESALRLHADNLQGENESLREEIAALKADHSGTPAKVIAEKPKKEALFKTGK